jgi:hypothetical protein
MDVEVEKPLRLNRSGAKPAPQGVSAKLRQKLSENALMGMGLWMLLWLGYNTGPELIAKPDFPANTTQLIHGIRAYFPILAGWIAMIVIVVRASRLFSWIMGPLGLTLFYSIVGMATSATLSLDPSFSLFYAANYLAIILVLLAIVLVEDPRQDLLYVLKLTWVMGTMLTLALLGAIPILGSSVIVETEGTPFGMRAYGGGQTIMGMASSRNTGFARYAAISALWVLPGLLRKGKLSMRIAWGVLFAASIYALVLANGRTEILAFIASLVIVLAAEKARRLVYFLAGIAAALILGLRGFYSEFYLYFTRTGHLDFTMTGRTAIWEEGWNVFMNSPWVGSGFQADRLLMGGLHMHNAFLHVLVQSGLLGGGAIIIALAIVWYYTIYYFFSHQPADKSLIPAEIPAILLFTTVSSITESTFAYYSAAWLLSAPIFAYVMALHQHMKRATRKAAQERGLRVRLARSKRRDLGPEIPPAPFGGEVMG